MLYLYELYIYRKILEVNLFAFMKISHQSTGRCMVLILFPALCKSILIK